MWPEILTNLTIPEATLLGIISIVLTVFLHIRSNYIRRHERVSEELYTPLYFELEKAPKYQIESGRFKPVRENFAEHWDTTSPDEIMGQVQLLDSYIRELNRSIERINRFVKLNAEQFNWVHQSSGETYIVLPAESDEHHIQIPIDEFTRIFVDLLAESEDAFQLKRKMKDRVKSTSVYSEMRPLRKGVQNWNHETFECLIEFRDALGIREDYTKIVDEAAEIKERIPNRSLEFDN